MKVPQHIAIILDGNGRWAKSKGMPRNYGHAQGSKNVERICEEAWRMGIKYLTVYAFSTENWSRPEKEVSALMKLLRKYLVDSIERTIKNNMRVRVIGEKSRLSEDIREAIGIILRTGQGERVMRPEFGSNTMDYAFAPVSSSMTSSRSCVSSS